MNRGEYRLIEELKSFLQIVKKVSPNAFINNFNNELIIEPRNNIYFRLDNIDSDMELKCKVIAWLSMPSCKGVSNYWQRRFLQIINEFLKTNFTTEQIAYVSAYLGMDCNRPLTMKFIESGYDLSILPQVT